MTDFNAVEDPARKVLRLASPPEGSVAPELVNNFIYRNNLWTLANFDPFIQELKAIPTEKWDLISTFLSSSIYQNKNSELVGMLSRMPIEKLNLIINYALQHKVAGYNAIYALKNVSNDSFNDFINLIEKYALQNHTYFWPAIVDMPQQYQEQLIIFCRDNGFDEKKLQGVSILCDHTPDNWPEIINYINQVPLFDGELRRLKSLSAERCLLYIRFIIKNQVTNSSTKKVLSYTPDKLKQLLLDFVKKYNLHIDAFEDIWFRDWPRLSQFIEQHINSESGHLTGETVQALSNIYDKDWPKFVDFIDTHKIQEFSWIGEYAKMSAIQREYLFDFISKYQIMPKDLQHIKEIPLEQLPAFISFIDTHEIRETAWIVEYAKMSAIQRNYLYAFSNKYKVSPEILYFFTEVKVEQWPDFLSLAEEHNLSNENQLAALAKRDPTEREACAKLIANSNMNNFYSLFELENMSAQHFHFLCSFAEEYNIKNEFVLYGLSLIPSIRQWPHIYELVQPLIVEDIPEPFNYVYLGSVMRALYKITVKQHRIDRVMPSYGEEERLARYAIVRNQVDNGLIRRDYSYYDRIIEILETPVHQLGNMHRAAIANATTISVHADGRDEGTGQALQQLMSIPYDINQVDEDYAAFLKYLNAFPNAFTKTNAQYVLGLTSVQVDGFAPLAADTLISSFDLNITGKEFLARCWSYIQQGEFIGNNSDESLAKDRENARMGLVRNIADAYEDESVLCNPGKLQHIAVGILQGRLKNAHIDREIPISSQEPDENNPTKKVDTSSVLRNTVASSLRYFLIQYEGQSNSQQELKSHVESWLIAERGLNGDLYQQYRIDFQKELDEYLRLSDLPIESAVNASAEQSVNLTHGILFRNSGEVVSQTTTDVEEEKVIRESLG